MKPKMKPKKNESFWADLLMEGDADDEENAASDICEGLFRE